MKPETEKQMSATSKAFKPIEAYLQRKKKLAQAFDALADKTAKTEQEHKSFLQKAGAMEAKRLLGEASDGDAQTLDTGIINIRDQQDRLAAAHQALSMQKAEMDKQVKPLNEHAAQALTQLKRAIEAEMDQELVQAAARISAVVGKLYTFYNATSIGIPNSQIMDLIIPSAVNGENLFQSPVRFHSSNHDEVRSYWDSDPEAKDLHDRLQGFGMACNALRRDERALDEQESQAEREAGQRRCASDAA